MKKLLALALVVFGLAACQTEPEGINVDANGEAAVTLNVALPDDATRAAGANSALGAIGNVDLSKYDIRYILEVYDENGVLAKERMVETSDETTAAFSFRLVPGRPYNFVVWADFVENGKKTDLHYNTNEGNGGLRKVEVIKTQWDVIDESRDAYTDVVTVHNFSSAADIPTITLTRPFAKLRVVTNDIKEMISIRPAEVKVEYFNTKFRDTFDAFAETASGEYVVGALTATLLDSQKNPVDVYTDEKPNETGVQTLFADYFFGAVDDRVMFTMDVKDNGGRDLPQVTFNTNIPVKRNMLTTVYGPVLTDSNNITVTINPAFENGTNWNPGDDKYDVEIWDGKTLTAPKYNATDDVWEISTGSQLAWLAAAVSGTLDDTRATLPADSFKGKTFRLTEDINLGENAWKPIGLGGKHFEGIFDGQGHVITGLKITERFGGDRFALFCSLAGSAQIKNVVIDNAYIKYPADGEDCYASAIAGTIYGDILFEGITVKNSTITGNNKVGAIFAHDGSSTKITINDCHVDNCYIASEDLKDGGCVGGLVGYFATGNEGKPNTISNSSVKKTTIVGINSSNNGKRANSLVIGSIKTKATMELNIVNCVLENNTFSQTIDGTAPVTYVGTFNPQYIGGDREEAHLGKITIDGYEVIANGVGLKDGEYYMQSVAGLKWLAEQVNGGNSFSNKTVKLSTDLDLNNEEWTPIGNSTNKFQGTFDGQDHKIANLLITGNNNYVGLFGFTTNGEIKNLVVENAEVSGRLGVGVVVGSPYTSKFNDITVQGHVEVNGKFYVGGVGGYNAYASWNNVTVNVDETSYVDANSVEDGVAYRTYVGGVTGFNGEGSHSFTNITSNIDVKGSTIDVGGLFGIAHYGNKYENCSCSGDVEIYDAQEAVDAQEIGGIAGVWNNHNDTTVTMTNCTFTGKLKANIADVDFYYGGLVGKPYSETGTGILWLNGNKCHANGIIEDENGNLVVNSLDSLEEALKTAGAAGAGDTTIVFAENTNINMTNAEWTPIKVDGYHGADIVTIEGNGAVITGLKAPLFAGGFAGGSGIVIKDLTIKDSDIVSANTLGSGAFIESVDSMAKIELTNCHLLNSTVTGGAGSRTGGLIGWTAGYNNVNDSPVKTYVTIDNCSVIGCTIQCDGSVGGINGHAGNNAWTYTTIKNCTIQNNNLNSTDDGEWRTGVVVGTANVGEVTISNITESGNTLTQTGKTAPEGFKRNYYGRFVPGTTGKLTIDGEEVVMINTAEKLVAAIEDAKAGDTITIAGDITLTENVTIPAGVTFNGNGKQINGTLIAGGDIAFAGHTKVTSFSAGFSGYEITIGEGACLEITGSGRSTMGYNNTFNITGTITDAKSADKANIQPSLIMPDGISITGGNGLELNIKDAYVKIGNTTSKNSAANGTFTINIENSIAEFTNQLTFSEPTSGKNPTFNLNVKNSVLTTATKLILAAANCNMVVDNSTIDVKTNFRNSGNVELKNGSVLTGNTIQFGENGGHDGNTTVDASKFTIKASSAGHAYDGRGTGSITLKNGAEVSVDYYKDLTINSDASSTFTGTQVL